MGTRLFVGNISYNTTEQSLRALFEGRGWSIKDAVIVTDRQTGRSRGFGFVEFVHSQEAREAQMSLNGEELDGRRVTLREAYERTPRPAFDADHAPPPPPPMPRGAPPAGGPPEDDDFWGSRQERTDRARRVEEEKERREGREEREGFDDWGAPTRSRAKAGKPKVRSGRSRRDWMDDDEW